MKGHKGSRPLRERTKERRVRLKPNNQRPSLKREHGIEKGSQDSESAYHTHEASDCIVDRTSSIEQDSNGSDRKNSSVENKLDISPNMKASSNTFLQKHESQESDFPKDSMSDDDKLAVIDNGCEKSKRNSQSISSDNDEEVILEIKTSPLPEDNNGLAVNENVATKFENSINVNDNVNLDKKIQFEGKSHARFNTKEVNIDCPKKSDKVALCREEAKSSLENSPDRENRIGANHSNIEHKDISSQENVMTHSCQSSQQAEKLFRNGFTSSELKRNGNSPSHSTSSVHFTKELVQLREITPKSSREGTPTHSQSDIVLQSKRPLRGTGMCQNTDSESESDTNCAANKLLPSVRRRRSNLSESTEISGTILRNRRQPSLPRRDTKTNSTTGVSSSEGETEGQCSEYSRSSKRVRYLIYT